MGPVPRIRQEVIEQLPGRLERAGRLEQRDEIERGWPVASGGVDHVEDGRDVLRSLCERDHVA